MHPANMAEKFVMVLAVLVLSSLVIVPMAAGAERLAVSVDVANVRSGPGTENAKLWQVKRNTPLEVIDSQDGWYLFKDFEGTKGWIHEDLVKEYEAVAVKDGKDLVNIRNGPGTDHDVILQAGEGVPFKVLEEKGDWLHVQHADGEKGWIHRALVW